jgi:predicted transcriptional regulator YheO
MLAEAASGHGALDELGREAKQRGVRELDERVAFTLRRSIEDVADALGVSRVTIYNYLDAIRASGAAGDQSDQR